MLGTESGTDTARNQIVEGAITERNWTVINKKDAYNFSVVTDCEEKTYVIGTNKVQPVTDEPLPQVPPAPLRVGPKETGFSPQVSDDRDEDRKEARKRASQQEDSPQDSAE